MGVVHGDRNSNNIRVSKALHGDACFRCAMEGGHGGLMVCKGPIAGNIYDTAERWSGRHEALSNLIGVFVCVFSPKVNFLRFFSGFFRQAATLHTLYLALNGSASWCGIWS